VALLGLVAADFRNLAGDWQESLVPKISAVGPSAMDELSSGVIAFVSWTDGKGELNLLSPRIGDRVVGAEGVSLRDDLPERGIPVLGRWVKPGV
jgi:hypothetical protein